MSEIPYRYRSCGWQRVSPLRALSLALLLGGVSAMAHAAAPSRVIFLDQPATLFTESTPLGNGRLGAALYGGVDEERIVLNESGMWSGSRQNADRPGAAEALPEIRRLLLEGKNVEAEKLVNEHFTCAGEGSGLGRGANVPFGCYQVLANLKLRFMYPKADTAVSEYERKLDLGQAVAAVTYTRGGVHYRRDAFVSAPDEVFVTRFTADQPGALSFDLELDRPERSVTAVEGGNELYLSGQLNDGKNGTNGVRFCARARVILKGGKLSSDGARLRVRGADEVTLLVTAATDIKTFAGRKVDDAQIAAMGDLERALKRAYPELRDRHVADYRRYFDRVQLRLGSAQKAEAFAGQPTPKRLAGFADANDDADLAALYFDYGRYLLISSSRPGGLPANLQGIWAESVQTPWNCDWHLNINVQMNYWISEVGNLSELHRPLFDLIASLQQPGANTAKTYFGAHGWVAFVFTNPWGFTSPGESANWGATCSGSAWLCQHLWDHYLFTGDREFLAWAYPIMKGSALFYLDMLIEEPSHHWLVTAPSNSPENSFVVPGGGNAHVCMGPTADEQLVRALFSACEQASSILKTDTDFRKKLEQTRARLAPTRVGSDGRVMEWLQPYEEVDPHHRHVSHLLGLYPLDEIDARRTPELGKAAAKTLDTRGDEGTGWGLALKLAMWARLGDGERAHRLLHQHLKPATQETEKKRWSGGTYANLWDAHPPFQIDGNLGGAAAIAEMLLQSQGGEIKLLPALPTAWAEGSVAGLRARGGFEVDETWSGGQLVEATIRGQPGAKARVVNGEKTVEIKLPKSGEAKLNRELRLVGKK